MPLESNSQFRAGNSSELQLAPVPFSNDIKKKLIAFRNGDITSLDNPDIIAIIAQYIFDLYDKGDLRYALILLENLGEWSRNDTIEYRERSLMVLSLITEKVLEEGNEDFLEALAHLLIRWLKKETEFLVGFEFVCLQLRKIVERMLQLGLWYQSEDLIAVLHQIKKGHIKKNNILTQIVSRIHSHLAAKDFLEHLTRVYIDQDNEKRDVAGTLLVHFGDKAVLHLLLALSNSPHKNERFQLIDLIPSSGPEAIPALIETLHRKPPWYVIRNIILIISKLSDPSLYDFVKVFLKHKDIRVQQEVIDCIRQMNGTKMVNRLLEALEICNDKLKPQIIRYLGSIQDKRVEKAFSGLIRKSNSFEQHVKDEIISEVCNYLPMFPSPDTISALQEFLNAKTNKNSHSQETIRIVENTLTSLEEKSYLIEMEGTVPVNGKKESIAERDDLIPALSHIDIVSEKKKPAYMERGASSRVSKESSAETGDEWNTFSHTSRKAGLSLKERHEDETLAASLNEHKVLREELYQHFSEEEFYAFSSYLVKRTYNKGETLVAYGDVHSHLYFIDSGEIRLSLPEEDNITYIRPLRRGDIFGNDIFMSGSEWDVTLRASKDSEVYSFDQEQLLKMQLRFPKLALKILDYCKNHDVILGLFRMIQNRRPIEKATATIPFTGNAGDPIAEVEIIDISSVGFCFSLTLPRGFSHSLFADKSLSAFFSAEPDLKKEVEAHVLGLKFIESDNCRLIIFARFTSPVNLIDYNCTRISLF